MEMTLTGHNIEITDPLRAVIEKKFEKIIRHFHNDIIGIHVILTSQKFNHTIEAIIRIAGAEVNAKGTSDTMYKAADVMINKLDRQLRRFKKRLDDRKKD